MNKKNTLFFSIALICAAIIVAAGIIISNKPVIVPEIENIKEYVINPITEKDHMLGNPDADIILVEYSDFRCPYCREFHITMQRLINEYGKTGNLAWVYRHFPREDAFENKNSLSMMAAIASECVADIGGEDMFWNFVSAVHSNVPITFDKTDLEKIAIDLGIDKDAYTACLTSGKFTEKINQSIADGLAIYEYDSNFGTPYNIIITKSGHQLEVVGSQSYIYMKEIIKQYAFPTSL